MLLLINTNRMMPPIAPVGLDYLAGAARKAGEKVEVIDLCLAEDPEGLLVCAFQGALNARPDLIGISFRNVDDCFWPGAAWFVPELESLVKRLRSLSDAPIVLGGVGFSIFPQQLVARTDADFGIHGDGEQAVLELLVQLRGQRQFQRVPGLVWREGGSLRANRPAWPAPWSAPTIRDAVDNPSYFRLGGQIGVESKRGCNRPCLYCADPLAKGAALRLRDPKEVADEIQALAAQGCEVLHLCDSEFNLPASHALAVCEELIRRGLGHRVRWYAYLATMPFDAELARQMRKAGCVGINFTGDSAAADMLDAYRHPHRAADLARNVRLCREQGIAVMIDLLLGGPGETPESAAATIQFIKCIDPDCAGAALGVRVYPGTRMAAVVASEGPPDANRNLRRVYSGPIDFLKPTFYVSEALGEQPARLIRDLIAGDQRFFEPGDGTSSAYNYNENAILTQAIAAGARGAYWDILRKLRGRQSPTSNARNAASGEGGHAS